MTTIVTRAGKGSALTHAEVDANFTNLNNDKVETTAIANMLETSDIGTTVQAYSANLDEYAAVNPTSAGLALLDDADASAQRTTLGLGTAATTDAIDYATAAQGSKADTAIQPADIANMLETSDIGVSVQAYDAQLADVAGLTPTDNGVIIGNGTNFVVESGSTLRTSLGLAIGTDVQAYDPDLTTWAGKTAPTGDVVGTSDNQTLTNKTIVAANNTITTAASGNLTSTELNAALAELQSDIDTRATSGALSDHLNDPTDAHDASAISVTPVGALVSTDVQAALAELDSEKISKTSNTGSAVIPSGTTAQRDGVPSAGYFRFNDDIGQFEGHNGAGWLSIGGGGDASYFKKPSIQAHCFTKTGAGAISVLAGTEAVVNGTLIPFGSDTAVVMPSLNAGTDYAIYICDDGTIRADASFTAPSGYTTTNSRQIGGFHYAPGGNATAQSGGNTTPAINEYSIWDIKFRPACVDPRGMALIAGSFWADIYLLGVDYLTNGSSKYNVSIADGSSPPKRSTLYGGNGTTTYADGNWWNMNEALKHCGKRSPTYSEFAALAYGTTEATSSGGSDVPTTGVTGTGATSAWNLFTSKFGIIQATGCIWVWGDEFGGGNAGASWTANTQGRGSTYQMENAVILGGAWDVGGRSGSRCSNWGNAAPSAFASFGARGVCDHLTLV